MAENQNENPEQKTIEALKKEADKIFEKGKKKIEDKIGGEEANYRDKPYGFYLNNVEDELMKPLRKTYEQKRAEMSAVEQGQKSVGEKIQELANLKDELRAEIETGYENAIALIEKQTDGEAMITRKVLGKMELYAPFLTQLAESKKGKPLAEIFNEMTVVTSLGEDGGEYEKILTKAILDPELTPLAFFVLTMARKEVREEFAERFIEKYPEKGTWLLEKGNEYGCYDAVQMKKYLLLLKEKPASQADAEKELQDFDKNEPVFNGRFDAMQMPKKRIEGLYARDASNYALNNLTFKGVGRVIGYGSSVLTILANLVANRKEYMKQPSLMAKNVYLWGAVGGLSWLVRTGQGKRIGDIFTSKATTETTESKKKLKEFNYFLGRSTKWSEFFDHNAEGVGGAELLARYSNYIKTQGRIARVPPTVEGFLVFCKEREDESKVPEGKRASLKFRSMADANKDQVQKELEKYVDIFEGLQIENQADFVKTMDNAKEV